MKRMTGLKDDLEGVKCEMTIFAFNYLKKIKKKPRLVKRNGVGDWSIRVRVAGRYFEYVALSGKFAVTQKLGCREWSISGSVADFIARAELFAERQYPPSPKQIKFCEDLAAKHNVEIEDEVFYSKDAAAEFISKHLEIERSQNARRNQFRESETTISTMVLRPHIESYWFKGWRDSRQ